MNKKRNNSPSVRGTKGEATNKTIYTLIAEANDLFEKPDFKSAIDKAQQAYFLSCEQDYSKGKTDALIILGFTHIMQGENLKAREYLLQALEVAKASQEMKSLNKIYSRLGMVYCEMGLSEEGLNYFSQAVETSKEMGNDTTLANDYSNLAIALMRSKNIPLAVEYLDKAKQLAEQSNDEVRLGVIYSNLSQCAGIQNDHQSALDHALTALTYCEKQNQVLNTIYLYSNIANALCLLKRYDEGINHAQKCLDLATAHNVDYHIALSNMILSHCYRCLKNYSQAESCLISAEKIETLKTNEILRLDHFNAYLRLYEDMGDYKKAYEKLKEQNEFERRINSKKSAMKKENAGD